MEEEQPPQWSARLIRLRTVVEEIGKTLAPDEDWIPTVFVEGTYAKGMPGISEELYNKHGIIVVGAPDSMRTEETKDRFCEFLFMLAVVHRAVGMTLISVVWMVEADKDSIDLTIPPSQNPKRKEGLSFMSAYLGGEDDGSKLVTAEIDRSGDHPRLYNWKIIDEGGGTESRGRFPDAMRAGLQMVSMLKAKGGKDDPSN